MTTSIYQPLNTWPCNCVSEERTCSVTFFMGSHFLAVWQRELSHALEVLTACWKSHVRTYVVYRLRCWVQERVSGMWV